MIDTEIERLKERHTARLCDHLGHRVSEDVKQDVRRSFGWFAEDVEEYVQQQAGSKKHGTGKQDQ